MNAFSSVSNGSGSRTGEVVAPPQPGAVDGEALVVGVVTVTVVVEPQPAIASRTADRQAVASNGSQVSHGPQPPSSSVDRPGAILAAEGRWGNPPSGRP